MAGNAWIEIIPDEDATGELRALYDQERDRRTGAVDNIMMIHSLNPATLRSHADLYHTVMHGESSLSYAEREMIGVVVSSINKCHY